MKYVIVVLLVIMVACGAGLWYCGQKAVEIVDEVTDEGGNISDPLGALSALGGMANDLEKLGEDLEGLEPTDRCPSRC